MRKYRPDDTEKGIEIAGRNRGGEERKPIKERKVMKYLARERKGTVLLEERKEG